MNICYALGEGLNLSPGVAPLIRRGLHLVSAVGSWFLELVHATRPFQFGERRVCRLSVDRAASGLCLGVGAGVGLAGRYRKATLGHIQDLPVQSRAHHVIVLATGPVSTMVLEVRNSCVTVVAARCPTGTSSNGRRMVGSGPKTILIVWPHTVPVERDGVNPGPGPSVLNGFVVVLDCQAEQQKTTPLFYM
jgi:hypothetical protein